MNIPKERLERWTATLGVGLLAVIIIPQLSVYLTNLAWPLVKEYDPTVSGWITIHHLLEIVFAILVMKFVFGKSLSEWGFNLNKWRESLKIFRWFVLFYFCWSILTRLPMIVSGTVPHFGYPLTAANIGGVFAFRILLNGPAEEILFRGLVMSLLGKYWRGGNRFENFDINDNINSLYVDLRK